MLCISPYKEQKSDITLQQAVCLQKTFTNFSSQHNPPESHVRAAYVVLNANYNAHALFPHINSKRSPVSKATDRKWGLYRHHESSYLCMHEFRRQINRPGIIDILNYIEVKITQHHSRFSSCNRERDVAATKQMELSEETALARSANQDRRHFEPGVK